MLEDVDFEAVYEPFADIVNDGTVTRTQITDRRPTLQVWYDGEPADIIQSLSAVESTMLAEADSLEGPLMYSYEVDEDSNRVDVSMHEVWFSAEVSVVAKFGIPEAMQQNTVGYDTLYNDAVEPRGFDVFSPAGEPSPSLTEWNVRTFHVSIEENYDKRRVAPDGEIDIEDGAIRVDVDLDIWGLHSTGNTKQFIETTVSDPLDIDPSSINVDAQSCGLFSRSKGQLTENAARIGVSGLDGVLFEGPSSQ